jgi:hypothetical protein
MVQHAPSLLTLLVVLLVVVLVVVWAVLVIRGEADYQCCRQLLARDAHESALEHAVRRKRLADNDWRMTFRQELSRGEESLLAVIIIITPPPPPPPTPPTPARPVVAWLVVG